MSMDIGLLFGGRSTEHDASVDMYFNVMHSLSASEEPRLRVNALYYIAKNGVTYVHQITPPREFPKSRNALLSGEVIERARLPYLMKAAGFFIFSLMQGREGEDGKYQGVAEVFDIPGSFGETFSAAVGMNKWVQSLMVEQLAKGDLTPIETILLRVGASPSEIDAAVNRFRGRPAIVKPNSMGGSFMTKIVDEINAATLSAYLAELEGYDTYGLVQTRIMGREVTCGCFVRNGHVDVLPVMELLTAGSFFGAQEKFSPHGYEAIVLSDREMAEKIGGISRRLCELCGYHTLCRFDYLVDEVGRIYFLEVNTIPGLTKGSVYPKMLKAAGYDLQDLIIESIRNEERIVGRRRDQYRRIESFQMKPVSVASSVNGEATRL